MVAAARYRQGINAPAPRRMTLLRRSPLTLLCLLFVAVVAVGVPGVADNASARSGSEIAVDTETSAVPAAAVFHTARRRTTVRRRLRHTASALRAAIDRSLADRERSPHAPTRDRFRSPVLRAPPVRAV